MLKSKFPEITQTYRFLGSKVRKYLYLDLITGFLWFGVESSFIFVLQGFLVSIGLLNLDVALLPKWYPQDFFTNIFILLTFGILRTILTMAKNYLGIYSCQIFIREKRELLLSKALLARQDVSHQEIISAFSETVAYAGNYVVHLNHLVHGTVVTGLFTLICFKIAPFESLAGILLLFMFLFPLRKMAKNVNKHGEDMHSSWKISHGILLNGLKNIFYLRLHGMLDSEVDRGKNSLKAYEKSYHHYALTSSMVLGLPQLIGIIVLCVVAFVSRTYFKSDAGTLLSFFYLFVRFAQSASQTNNYFSYLKLTKIGFVQLQNMINRMGEELHFSKNLLPKMSDISFKVTNLKGGYPNKAPLFENLNFELGKSKLLVIKGPSGVGKSTLLRTILGETSPLDGQLTYNNNLSIDPSSLSLSIGYVGPEPFLIYGTVRENLVYGNAEHSLDEKEIWKMLKDVGLEEEILKFPRKLDEILLDETQLSQGQRQRLSLARALLRKPSFLVLDEATANIDSETEMKIIEVIRMLKTDMTTFVISHKNSFDFLADEIITLGKKN